MCELKIITITEDTCNKRALLAEHGLSLLIKHNDINILFDTGQGPTAVANARTLNIDLKKLHCIILSHGHDDHTGGLYSVLRKTGKIKIYAHPNVLKPKYKLLPSNEFQVSGLPNSAKELINIGAEFVLAKEAQELFPGIILTGEIPRTTEYETNDSAQFIEIENQYVPDTMPDDQALVIKTAKGPIVITGCAHAGLINTLSYAAQLAKSNFIYAVIGGTHLLHADEAKINKTIIALKNLGLKKIAVSHCTGFKAQCLLSKAFGEKFILNNTGDILEF